MVAKCFEKLASGGPSSIKRNRILASWKESIGAIADIKSPFEAEKRIRSIMVIPTLTFRRPMSAARGCTLL